MTMMRNFINNLCTPNAQPVVVTGEVINEEPPRVAEIVQPSTSLGKRKSSTKPKQTKNKKARCDFFNDEAEVSDDDSGNEEEEEEEENDHDREFIDSGEESMEGAEFYNRVNNELDLAGIAPTLVDPVEKPDLKVRTYRSVEDLPDTDYRRHPYVESTLPPENRELADALFDLVQRKGVFLMNI